MPHHDSETVMIPPSYCQECGNYFDRSSPAGDAHVQARPGSIVLCIRCGLVQIHASDMSVRPLTAAEAAEIMQKPDLLQQIAHITQAVHFFKHKKG